MNHRKFYLSELKINLPKNIEIHHLDGNRGNNNLDNLVAIPKFLHMRYHYYKTQIMLTDIKLEDIINVSYDSNNDYYTDLNKYLSMFLKLRPVYYEIKKWIGLRESRRVGLYFNNDPIELDKYNSLNLKIKR